MTIEPDPRIPSTDLHLYADRWIAILDERIVGQGLTREEALGAAKSSRPKERPQLRWVPPAGAPSLHTLLDRIRPALPAGEPVYLVGGAVRDHLLQRPIHDLDFVLRGSGIPAARAAANHLGGEFFILDDARGTGRVLLTRPDGERLILDFAAMRGETLEEDLRARDFTINAIAMAAEDPQRVHDPLGGARDLREKKLQVCSPTTFVDDPLRVLRAVRIALMLGFQMSAETRSLLRKAAPALPRVSPERQRDEVLKLLDGPRPAAALRALDLLGVLPQVFPDLEAMKGVRQSPPHVHEVWEHTLSVVEHLERLLEILAAEEHDPEAAGSLFIGLAVMRLGRYRRRFAAHMREQLVPDRRWRPLLFLAALYHDAGKPEARSLDENGRIRFFQHEAISARLLSRRAEALKLSNEEIQRLKTIARHHMRPHLLSYAEGLPSRRAIHRFFRDTGAAGVDICLLGLADALGTAERGLTQEVWMKYLDMTRELLEHWWERPEESVAPPALLNGRDLLETFDLEPGPLIGRLLSELREAQAAGEVQTRETALTYVRELLADIRD